MSPLFPEAKRICGFEILLGGPNNHATVTLCWNWWVIKSASILRSHRPKPAGPSLLTPLPSSTPSVLPTGRCFAQQQTQNVVNVHKGYKGTQHTHISQNIEETPMPELKESFKSNKELLQRRRNVCIASHSYLSTTKRCSELRTIVNNARNYTQESANQYLRNIRSTKLPILYLRSLALSR
jgi:hypothetical protein